MKKLNLEEVKKIQLEILNTLDTFCKNNTINYWLDCGSLLGAVRHKGYIPWDDDIDIGMLREDYDKFIKLFNKENDRYKFLCFELDNNFLYPFGKLVDTNTVFYEPNKETGIKLNVNIDVFAYDNAPDDEKECEKMFKKKEYYGKLRISKLFPNKYNHNSLKKRIIRFFLKGYFILIPKNYYTKKTIENSKKYINVNTKRIANFCVPYKATFDKDIFKSFILLEFEGKKYPAPIGYHTYLTNYYGNYMKLPPKKDRIGHHQFEAYLLDEKK